MILQADARHIPLADASVHCVVTSPPYWVLRDYGVTGQLGLERMPEEYVANMVAVFREVWRVLRDDGTLWVNMGDSYASQGGPLKYDFNSILGGKSEVQDYQVTRKAPPGLKPKDLVGIPWRLAFALQANGWYLRSDIIWSKPNPMPESVTDRPTKAHEYIFVLSKRARYFFDQEAVREPAEFGRRDWGGSDQHAAYMRSAENMEKRGDRKTPENYTKGSDPSSGRNLRSVWTISTQPYSEAHFATFPEEIPKRAILAGTSARGCCPACGAPWERVTETGYKQHRQAGPWCERGQDERGMDRSAGMFKHGSATRVDVTTGWRPTCACGRHDTVPCTVLDPFAGSGTTVAVAESLGRRGIGLELKWEYITLAQKRLASVTGGLPLG